MQYGDDGSKLVECLISNKRKVRGIYIDDQITICEAPRECALTEGSHKVDIASSLYLILVEPKSGQA